MQPVVSETSWSILKAWGVVGWLGLGYRCWGLAQAARRWFLQCAAARNLGQQWKPPEQRRRSSRATFSGSVSAFPEFPPFFPSP